VELERTWTQSIYSKTKRSLLRNRGFEYKRFVQSSKQLVTSTQFSRAWMWNIIYAPRFDAFNCSKR
jgi:hypothetical protein